MNTKITEKIKNDEVLMVLFLAYAVQDSGIHNVILSGEIGAKYTRLQLHRKIPEYINIGYVNGGLRKGDSIRNTYFGNGNCIPDYFSNKVIFIDDSYYSGKTANKVRNFIESLGGEVIKTYVFYDGSKEKHDNVVSLYRYYDWGFDMTDKEKFKQLFTEVGIEFAENGNLLEVDKFYVDGSSDDVDFVVSFYDDEDLKDKFQEFRVYDV